MYNNAIQLIRDAQILFKNGSHPRCVSLCILAQEEISKILQIVQLLYQRTDGRDPLTAFDKDFTKHDRKIIEFMTMHFLDDVLNKDGKHAGLIVSQAKSSPAGLTFSQMRKQGFYVDFDRNKKQFISPTEVIGDSLAAEFLRNIEQHIEVYSIFGKSDVSQVVERLKGLIAGLQDDTVRAQMDAESRKVQNVLLGRTPSQ